jgi:MYXO-CTERM domain-containing protein
LQMGFPRPGFLLTDIQLPSPDVSEPQVARLVMNAIALADLRAPAATRVTARRELGSDNNAHTVWDVGFFHRQVALTPGRCQLSVQTGEASGARLFCRLPDETPLRFDAFNVAEDTALEIAKTAAEIDAGQSSITALYLARGVRAQARYYVVLSDGRTELLAELDGAGEVLALGSNERDFRFSGYDLDYLRGFQPSLTAPIAVGLGLPEVLDTMNVEAGTTSCKRFGGVQPQSGFAACNNDVLRSSANQNFGQYLQPVVAPRSDEDFTNPAGAPAPFPDPLPPQAVVFGTSVPTGGLLHGALDVVARPFFDEADYLRNPPRDQERPFGPAHHAELQAFYSAGERQRFYRFLDLRFAPGNQDRFRTELTVHWNPKFDTSEEGAATNAGGRAARFLIKMSDVRPTAPNGQFVDEVAYDGEVDGGIFAHEYHHHIQENLAVDENWLPDVGDLFPGNAPCTPSPECRRRFRILEGTADGFGSLAVDRGLIGTTYASKLSVEQLDATCANREAFGDGMPLRSVRAVCNNRAFGYWQDPDTTCGDPTTQFASGFRQLVIGGAMYLFQQRLLEGGVTKTLTALPLLEAERTLQAETDGEIEYLQQLLVYLGAQPADTVRRYQYAARAAFVEKGMFSPSLHAVGAAFGGDLDDRVDLRCNAPGCTPSNALFLSGLSLTLSGPLRWDEDPDDPDAQLPVFDAFAPPGSACNRALLPPGIPPLGLTWLELSDNPTFNGQSGFFSRTQFLNDQAARINCAPVGFFRPTAPNTEFRAAVRAAAQGSGRVYYRLRQCLAGSGPTSSNCIVSTLPSTPAFMTVQPAGPGCACKAAGRRMPAPWGWLALGVGALLVRRRKKR